jgi:hypothetical protein
MVSYVFLLTVLFAAGAMANKAAGKWQLLFFYQVYRYQADALGIVNTEMAVDCSVIKGVAAVCDMKGFVKKVCVSNKIPKRDSKNKVITPVQLFMDPDFDSVDWDAIGDGETFNHDKFSSEMDRVNFSGGVKNEIIFKGWGNTLGSFATAMDAAVRVVEKAQAELASKEQPISNARYQALVDALEVHANVRRYDQATQLLKQFGTWAAAKGYTVQLGDEISRSHVPPYRQIDSEAMVRENSLTGDKANELRNWVDTQNAAGQSKTHVEVITKAGVMHTKLAAACKK